MSEYKFKVVPIEYKEVIVRVLRLLTQWVVNMEVLVEDVGYILIKQADRPGLFKADIQLFSKKYYEGLKQKLDILTKEIYKTTALHIEEGYNFYLLLPV